VVLCILRYGVVKTILGVLSNLYGWHVQTVLVSGDNRIAFCRNAIVGFASSSTRDDALQPDLSPKFIQP
jgi:hypothetical protein